MKIALPNSFTPIVEDKTLTQSWARYFNDAHNALGLGGANHPLWSNRGMVDASSMDLDDTTPPAHIVAVGGIKTRGFEKATSQSLYKTIVLGSGYQTGVDLRPCIRWMPLTADSGAVRWGIEYAWGDVGAPIASSTSIYVSSASTGVAFDQVLEQLDAIAGASSFGPGSTILFRVFRDVLDSEDTYPDTAILLAAGFVTSDNAPGTSEVNP